MCDENLMLTLMAGFTFYVNANQLRSRIRRLGRKTESKLFSAAGVV